MSSANVNIASAPVAKKIVKKKVAETSAAAVPAVVASVTTTPTSAAAVTAPTVAAPVPADTVPTKKAPVKGKKLAADQPSAVPVAAAPVVVAAAPVVVEPVVETNEASSAEETGAAPQIRRRIQITPEDVKNTNKIVEDGFANLIQTIKEKKIQGVTKLIESLKKTAVKGGNDALKAIEHAKKSNKRKVSTSLDKKPSGLQKPVLLSAAFCEVTGLDPSVPTTRQEAINRLYKYMIEHNLKDPTNGRRCIPDEKILSLLRGWDGESYINYITIRRYVSHHFSTAATEEQAIAAN